MSLLSVTRRGAGRPFVWLHGFTQTRDSAHRFRSILAETLQLWTTDLPGHGSAHAVTASLDETADLVSEVLPDEPVDLGGYSLGGRVALHVAMRHPGRVARLVVLGASRGIADDAERSARRRRDDDLAEHLEEIGAEAFLVEWLGQPLFASVPKDPAELAARSRDASGLAASLRHAGTGTQAWLGPRLALVTSPTLALAGSRDVKFVGESREIARGVVDGHAAEVPDAGHAAHLEQPDAAAALVLGFLA
jgi:2-succinyl-6-hydroxy-2,4-cyclohexadiene-1-carboxylate synthase